MAKETKRTVKRAIRMILSDTKAYLMILPLILWRDKKYILTKVGFYGLCAFSLYMLLNCTSIYDAEFYTLCVGLTLPGCILPASVIYEKDFDVHREKRDNEQEV